MCLMQQSVHSTRTVLLKKYKLKNQIILQIQTLSRMAQSKCFFFVFLGHCERGTVLRQCTSSQTAMRMEYATRGQCRLLQLPGKREGVSLYLSFNVFYLVIALSRGTHLQRSFTGISRRNCYTQFRPAVQRMRRKKCQPSKKILNVRFLLSRLKSNYCLLQRKILETNLWTYSSNSMKWMVTY